MEPPVSRDLRIHLYADGADIQEMVAARRADVVNGFTTNPTLMHKAGITDYEAFARQALEAIPETVRTRFPWLSEAEARGRSELAC